MLQEYLDQLFDAFKEGICISDVEGTVVHLNRRHAEITGIPREEMLGHSVMEFVKRGRLDVVLNPEVIRTGQPATRVQTVSDGRKLILEANPVFDAQGKLVLCITFLRDVTMLSEMREQMSVQKELLEAFQQLSTAGDAQELSRKTPKLFTSSAMIKLYGEVNTIAETDATVLLLGESGAGKSTLFNAVAGVFAVDSGRIVLDGQELTGMPDYKRSKFIGRMFQDPMRGTAAGMMISENLAIADRRGRSQTLRWSDRADRTAYFTELVKMLGLGLENRMTAHVGLLSGGQRQALTLLMATLVRPKLLLLDEHTAALDPKTAAKVLELTEKLVTEQQLTTLMITHNMRDALRYGNRLIMMHDGRPILDVRGEEKAKLTAVDLLQFFEKAGDGVSDKMLLG